MATAIAPASNVAGEGQAPLKGTVVLEAGGGFAAAFAGRLLASYGATVIKAEDNGPSDQGGADQPGPGTRAYLDAGKWSVAFDHASSQGRELLERLGRECNIVIRFLQPAEACEPFDPGPDSGPVAVDLSWFGRTGPWRGFAGDDFLAQHASGMGFTSALRQEDIANNGPRSVPGHLAEMVAGLTAATAAIAGLSRHDAGLPPERVDISVVDAIVSFMRYETVIYSYGWGLPSRSKQARSPVAAPVFQQASADGYVDIMVMREDPWRELLSVLGDPSWGENPLFATHPLRSEYWDALEPLLQEELRKHTSAFLFREGQQRGVPVAPVNTVAEAAASEQFESRQFFTSQPTATGTVRTPGRPFALGDELKLERAPVPGEHTRAVLAEWLAVAEAELVAAGARL